MPLRSVVVGATWQIYHLASRSGSGYLCTAAGLNCGLCRQYGPRDDMNLLLLKDQPAHHSDSLGGQLLRSPPGVSSDVADSVKVPQCEKGAPEMSELLNLNLTSNNASRTAYKRETKQRTQNIQYQDRQIKREPRSRPTLPHRPPTSPSIGLNVAL